MVLVVLPFQSLRKIRVLKRVLGAMIIGRKNCLICYVRKSRLGMFEEQNSQSGDIFHERRMLGIQKVAMRLEIIISPANVRDFIGENPVAGES